MECCTLTCLAWASLMIVGLLFVLNFFKKKIFAALCSRMAKGPLMKKEKKAFFSRLNDEVRKAGSRKLKVWSSKLSFFCYFLNMPMSKSSDV